MSGTGPSRSMRENYNTLGVDKYYNLVSSSYRNPHFVPVKHCIYDWMNTWWAREGLEMDISINENRGIVKVFDLACGRSAFARMYSGVRRIMRSFHLMSSGEVTEALISWLETARRNHTLQPNPLLGTSHPARRKVHWQQSPPPVTPEDLSIFICAADPYTASAYHARVRLTCAELSFQDVADGALPTEISELCPNQPADSAGTMVHSTSVPAVIVKEGLGQSTDYAGEDEAPSPSPPLAKLDMVICSFALHLIETPSQLFSLLWELSHKARWLIIITPHKKPEVKDGWGWLQWNINKWRLLEHGERESEAEILEDRHALSLLETTTEIKSLSVGYTSARSKA